MTGDVKNWQDKVEQLAQARFLFNDPAWKTVSSAGKGFVRGLLKKQPGFRWTAREAMDHCTDLWDTSLLVRPGNGSGRSIQPFFCRPGNGSGRSIQPFVFLNYLFWSTTSASSLSGIHGIFLPFFVFCIFCFVLFCVYVSLLVRDRP